MSAVSASLGGGGGLGIIVASVASVRKEGRAMGDMVCFVLGCWVGVGGKFVIL